MNDTRKQLELARFEELLDRYGADPMRFPEIERAAVLALLARDAGARQLLAEAVALERVLASMQSVEPSAALRRAVAEIPLRNPRPAFEQAFGFLPLRSVWALFSCAALIMALGAASGAWAEARVLSFEDGAAPSAEVSSDDEALAEWTELAFAVELERELAP